MEEGATTDIEIDEEPPAKRRCITSATLDDEEQALADGLDAQEGPEDDNEEAEDNEEVEPPFPNAQNRHYNHDESGEEDNENNMEDESDEENDNTHPMFFSTNGACFLFLFSFLY